MWSDVSGVLSLIYWWSCADKFVKRCNNPTNDLTGLAFWTLFCYSFYSIMHNLVKSNKTATLVILEQQK